MKDLILISPAGTHKVDLKQKPLRAVYKGHWFFVDRHGSFGSKLFCINPETRKTSEWCKPTASRYQRDISTPMEFFWIGNRLTEKAKYLFNKILTRIEAGEAHTYVLWGDDDPKNYLGKRLNYTVSDHQ